MSLARLPNVDTLHLANVTLPQGHQLAGQVCPVFAFLVRHPDAIVLIDTGIGEAHPVIDRLYEPQRCSLPEALAACGAQLSDVGLVINTHLHFDHCGANRLFPGVPVYVQRSEYEAALEPGYTVPEWVAAAGVRYEPLDGEVEILDGVSIIPTPGHTPGHQSVRIEGEDSRAILVGQAAYSTREFAGDKRAEREGAAGAWNADEYTASLALLRGLAASRAYFSHDTEVWEALGATER